ncbi:hypothetical protein PR048_016844 [Dryococelus australis]|uniref:Uncharacterized protein n=1 Tax=Dryococelus australis TaxID=614101 RepID=A0ABQ9H829_9NEOP|nr:hypothetical protein PR048_016844 [Dryococelus australis]
MSHCPEPDSVTCQKDKDTGALMQTRQQCIAFFGYWDHEKNQGKIEQFCNTSEKILEQHYKSTVSVYDKT